MIDVVHILAMVDFLRKKLFFPEAMHFMCHYD